MGAQFSTPTAHAPVTNVNPENQTTRSAVYLGDHHPPLVQEVILPTRAAHSRQRLLESISELQIMQGKPDYRLIEESLTMLWDDPLGCFSCRNLTIESDAQLGRLMDIKWMLKKRTVIMVKASLRDTANEAEGDDALGDDDGGGRDDDVDDDDDSDDSHHGDGSENRENGAAGTSGKNSEQRTTIKKWTRQRQEESIAK